ARADTSPPVVATHFGASLATFDVEIFLSSSLLAVFCSFWPNIGHSERESPLSANAILGNMERAAQNNQQDLCVASIPVPSRVNRLGELLCEQGQGGVSGRNDDRIGGPWLCA